MHISKIAFLFYLVSLVVSCNTVKNPLFGKRSAHEKYADAITKSGLEESVLAKAWLGAAQKALSYPQQITLPYKETGFFASDKPSAGGFAFKAVRGENIIATLSCNPDTVMIFLELWRPGTRNPSLIATIDTATKSLTYTLSKDDSLIIRIQPELLVDLEYTIEIATGPSLAFPVAKDGHPHFISFWGSGRDNGARTHEGIDIAAAFRTPALAAADGIISRVNENNLGGKVVFLRDRHTGNNLYYAHLDSQIAVEGQRVNVGDTVGLIGKTGNARNTVPHLHFGIYTMGGAINPLPFINPDVKEPEKITASLDPLYRFLRTSSSTSLYNEPSVQSANIKTVEKNEPVFILAATGSWYKVKLPGSEVGFIESRSLTDRNLTQLSIKQTKELKVQPFMNSPVKDSVEAGEKVDVLGTYGEFYFVNYKGVEGWIIKPV